MEITANQLGIDTSEIMSQIAVFHIDINDDILARSAELINLCIEPFDSLHLACAEDRNIEIFLTTDKKLINRVKGIRLKTKVYNPLSWLMEVLNVN
jgi:predicted nucleic acid-binding protein